jgi:hypothetical protein
MASSLSINPKLWARKGTCTIVERTTMIPRAAASLLQSGGKESLRNFAQRSSRRKVTAAKGMNAQRGERDIGLKAGKLSLNQRKTKAR